MSKKVFQEAARLMIERAAWEGSEGCCYAINEAWVKDSCHLDREGIRGHFSRLFKPENPIQLYWFGSAQYQIKNRKAKRIAREHRVYALLFAAESYESA